MLIEDRGMRVVAWWAWALLIAGCTRPNPKDCADGLCTDPAYPFCDIDGALEGATNTCIAVSCTPGEFRACRDDVSIVCNGTGNDYDLVACERGCDPMHGCRACTGPDDCANPMPICDPDANACRACRLDDECPSAVCEAGTCLNEAGILYVMPNGSDMSDCSRGQPCSMLQAMILARAAAAPPIIRLLPGVYANPIDIRMPSNLPFKFVASGASIAAQFAVRAEDGAQVEIRGLSASGTSAAINCASTTNTQSSLTLRDVVVTAGNGGASLLAIDNCAVVMNGGELDIGSSTGSTVLMLHESAFLADRIHVHGTSAAMIGAALATRLRVTIKNSLLENVEFQWQTNDTTSPGSSILIGFNTMVQTRLNCQTNSGSAFRKAIYENNIVMSDHPTSAVDGTDCTLSHNVLVPFDGAPGTNIAADPQFENSASKDYRLRATSPAVDAAVPSVLLPATTDLAGTMRPQGVRADIGAFERLP